MPKFNIFFSDRKAGKTSANGVVLPGVSANGDSELSNEEVRILLFYFRVFFVGYRAV